MSRSARQLLIASLVGLHAMVILGGHFLHGLPGWGHEAGLSRGADGDDGHRPTHSAHPESGDCPICHFFSLAQVPIDRTQVPAIRQACALKLETPARPATPIRLHTTSPRAPPIASASRS